MKWITNWILDSEVDFYGNTLQIFKRQKEDGTWYYRTKIKEL